MSLLPNGLAARTLLWWSLTGVAAAAGYLAWTYGEATRPERAQSGPAQGADPALDQQAQAVLSVVDDALKQFPPSPDPAPQRERALGDLDAVLRDAEAAHRPAVQDFFQRRIEEALAQMERADAEHGATVWHVYNQGFVVRTPGATVCFDLVRAKYLPGFALSETIMRRIVAVCDALFVSHVHADHAETFVAQTFVDEGKPVVTPRQVGYRDSLFEKVLHFDADVSQAHVVPIRSGSAALKIVVFPGHQGEEYDNNVVLVTTPAGISVAHTGDQWHIPDFEWIDQVSRHHRVDILLVNDWTYDIARLVRGFRPGVVVPGHANELGHPVEKRQPHLLSLQRKIGSSRFGGSESAGYAEPLVVMAWGERYRYERTLGK